MSADTDQPAQRPPSTAARVTELEHDADDLRSTLERHVVESTRNHAETQRQIGALTGRVDTLIDLQTRPGAVERLAGVAVEQGARNARTIAGGLLTLALGLGGAAGLHSCSEQPQPAHVGPTTTTAVSEP